MATYVALINWTDKGIQSYRDTLNRADKAADLGKSMNVNLKEIYWTLGQYDIVTIMEAPDDETATAFALALGSQGNIRTTSLRAFTREEMDGVVQRTPGS